MTLRVGQWRVRPELKRIENRSEIRELEPKVMDLLVLLASDPGAVVSREQLRSDLWGGVTVGDDAIARCVFKLRRALGDDSCAPRYVETVAKRGYRLIAPVNQRAPARGVLWASLQSLAAAAVAIFFLAAPAPTPQEGRVDRILIERARDYYAQYTQSGNESAAVLYERVLRSEPDHPEALAGLAMVEVQRAVRWSGRARSAPATLGAALSDGRLTNADALAALQRAERLLGRTHAGDRRSSVVLQAHGLLRSARGDLIGAEAAYREILDRDPHAWGAMINLADVLDLQHDEKGALDLLELAYIRLSTSYGAEVQRLGPWLAPLGIEIARRRTALGDAAQAQSWLRQVTADTGDATARVALERLQQSHAR